MSSSHRPDHLAHLRSESARFHAAVASLDPSTLVPTCPDWTVADLAWHITEGQHFWATLIDERRTDLAGYERPDRPGDHDTLLALGPATTARLVDLLATTDDDVSVWTWHDTNHTVGFVRRRQAHEALIHRLDAETAAGTRTPIDPELATDGVLEGLEWIFGGLPIWASIETPGPTGLLSTTDTGATWHVEVPRWGGVNPESGTTYRDEPTVLVRDGGEPGFRVRASAADLDAWLWRRPTVGPIEVSGDPAPLLEVLSLTTD